MRYEIAFVSGAEMNQHHRHESKLRSRAFILAEYFRRLGYSTVFLPQQAFEDHFETFETADIVLFHHPDISERMVRYLMNNKQKQFLVADYDDLVFDVSSVINKPDVVDCGESITNISRFYASKAEVGQMFDHRTASTAPLAEEANRIMGGETRVIHNALDTAYLDTAKRIFKLRDPEGVQYALGYIADTASSSSDLTTISSLIANYLREFPNQKMLLLGPVQIPSELEPFKDQIDHKEVHSYNAIPSLIAQCRVILRPSNNNKTTRCESSLKILEAAILGITVAASSIPDIERFNSPLLRRCRSPKDWESALRAPVLTGTHLFQEVNRLRVSVSLDRQVSFWKSLFFGDYHS
jgi:hypothetical protein